MFVIAWLLFVHKLTVGYATENISSSGIYKPEGFDVTLYQRFGVRATSPPLLARLSWKFMSSTHSQFEEDKILYAKFFYGYVNGTFIESGALVRVVLVPYRAIQLNLYLMIIYSILACLIKLHTARMYVSSIHHSLRRNCLSVIHTAYILAGWKEVF